VLREASISDIRRNGNNIGIFDKTPFYRTINVLRLTETAAVFAVAGSQCCILTDSERLLATLGQGHKGSAKPLVHGMKPHDVLFSSSSSNSEAQQSFCRGFCGTWFAMVPGK